MLQPDRVGGRDDDLSFDAERDRWLKFTKPHCADYAVSVVDEEIMMPPATPLQYLDRWRIQQRVFGDLVELCGVDHTKKRIVVSQRHLRAERPDWEQLEAWFARLALRRLALPTLTGGYDSRAYLVGRLAVFDVRPSNCVRTDGGEIVAIDLIRRYFNRRDTNVLRRFVVSK